MDRGNSVHGGAGDQRLMDKSVDVSNIASTSPTLQIQ